MLFAHNFLRFVLNQLINFSLAFVKGKVVLYVGVELLGCNVIIAFDFIDPLLKLNVLQLVARMMVLSIGSSTMRLKEFLSVKLFDCIKLTYLRIRAICPLRINLVQWWLAISQSLLDFNEKRVGWIEFTRVDCAYCGHRILNSWSLYHDLWFGRITLATTANLFILYSIKSIYFLIVLAQQSVLLQQILIYYDPFNSISGLLSKSRKSYTFIGLFLKIAGPR